MNTFMNIITSKATWVVIAMFLIATILMILIEKNVENDFLPILGIIPSIIIWYFYFVKSSNND